MQLLCDCPLSFQARGVNNFGSSIAKSLASVGYDVTDYPSFTSVLMCLPLWSFYNTGLQGVSDFDLYCPRAAPLVGVVSCSYHQWFQPYSMRRRHYQLPVSGRRMQHFVQFRSSHSLPVVTGHIVGSQRMDRADRVC